MQEALDRLQRIRITSLPTYSTLVNSAPRSSTLLRLSKFQALISLGDRSCSYSYLGISMICS